MIPVEVQLVSGKILGTERFGVSIFTFVSDECLSFIVWNPSIAWKKWKSSLQKSDFGAIIYWITYQAAITSEAFKEDAPFVWIWWCDCVIKSKLRLFDTFFYCEVAFQWRLAAILLRVRVKVPDVRTHLFRYLYKMADCSAFNNKTMYLE